MRRPWRRPHSVLLAGALVVSAMSACKPPPDAATTVKTLDNFAAGKRVRENSCGSADAKSSSTNQPMWLAEDNRIRFDDTVPSSQQGELKAIIGETLTSIPAEMQVMFMDFGGYIDVSTKTNARCTAFFREGDEKTSDQALEYAKACFTFEADPSRGTRFRINLAPEAKEIRHGLVRTFGYIYAQFVARLGEETDEMKRARGQYLRLSADEGTKFASIKSNLAESFLSDMIASKVFDLSVMESMLGPGSADIVRKNGGKLAGVSYRYVGETKDPTSAQQLVRRKRFEDYVFAEAFDSYYCRRHGAYPSAKVADVKSGKIDRDSFLQEAENTQRIMEDFFNNSFMTFKEVDRQMMEIAQRVANVSPLKRYIRGTSAGLALQGTLGTESDGQVVTSPQQQAPVSQRPGSNGTNNGVNNNSNNTNSGANVGGLMGALGNLFKPQAVPQQPAPQLASMPDGGRQ